MRHPIHPGVIAPLLPLLVSCALFRPAPEPGGSPVERPEELVTEPADPEPAPAARLGLAGARTMVVVGWSWTAEPLLAEVEAVARAEGDRTMQARALALRAVLAWERKSPEEAGALLRAAGAADPLGPVGGTARLAAEMMGRLGQREREIDGMRQSLAVAESGRQMSEEQTRALENEVGALRRQLDELKQVHLQVESEKDDDPS